MCSGIKEKETLNTRVNELSTVSHQKNSHCVDELPYKSHDKVNDNSCNNTLLKNTNSHDNDNTQDSECDLIMPSPYFNDETLINFSIYSLNC